jgi:hypothetical protein
VTASSYRTKAGSLTLFESGHCDDELKNDYEALIMSDRSALDLMAEGCVNDRVRIVFWDAHEEQFVALTPEDLLEHGAPYNGTTQEYLEYNSTHIAKA